MTLGSIDIKGLQLGYDRNVVVQLDELRIRAGEFVSILGPSGCGKSTLLAAIAGFNAPIAGVIDIDGQDITSVPAHRRDVGLVFQSYALFPHLTTEGNLDYGLKAHKVPRSERPARIREALELVRLTGYEKRYPNELSGGQQQRVAIARAIVNHPRVLLLDEPLSNLDAKLRRQMRREIRELQQEIGTTTLFVTHDQAEALSISDRVVLLAHGGIQQQGSPEELYRSPLSAMVADFVGAANILPGGITDSGRPTVLGVPFSGPSGSGPFDVALRPERLDIVDSGSGFITAEVLYVGFEGDRYEYRLQVAKKDSSSAVPDSAGAVLTAVTPAEQSPARLGDVVGVRWAEEAPIIVREP